jgi:hypothetical protein
MGHLPGAALAKTNQQRRTATSRIVLDEDGAEVSGPDEPADPATPPDEAPRSRTSALLVLLAIALTGSLLLSLTLWIKLERTRDELAEAAEESAVTRRLAAPAVPTSLAAPPVPVSSAATAAPVSPTAAAVAVSPTAAAVAVPQSPMPQSPAASAPAVSAPAADRLLLLLTVGTRHYAEKQARELRQKCRAPLAVYQQKHGRCAWSTCFAVAVPEADAELARNCGEPKGQALRERTDFIEVPPNR